MKKKKNKGPQGPKIRLASERDREAAANWAAAYRKRVPCVQVGMSDNGLIPLDGDDLARILEDFARDGTFAVPAVHADLLFVRKEFARLRAEGLSHRDALAELSVKHDVSESTIARRIKPSRGGTR